MSTTMTSARPAAINHRTNRINIKPDHSLDTLAPANLANTPGIAVAQHPSEVIQAWRLVYHSYRAANLIEPNGFQIHTMPQAVQPGTTVIIKRDETGNTSTVSCYRDSSRGLPLDAVYRDELDRDRQAGLRLAEIGLLAEKPGSPGGTINDLITFMRYPVYALYHQQVDRIVIGVHPRHAAFYQRLIGFEAVGEVKSYSLVRDHPVTLLKFDPQKLDAIGPAPKGLRAWQENRLEADAFADRFDFTPRAFENTVLHKHFNWMMRRRTRAANRRLPRTHQARLVNDKPSPIRVGMDNRCIAT